MTRTAMYENEIIQSALHYCFSMLTMQICDVLLVVVVVFALAPTADCYSDNVASK